MIMYDDLAALVSQAQGDLTSQAMGGTCYEDDFVRQFSRH